MSATTTPMSESHFTALLWRARAAGVTIELHDDPGCTFLVVPARRQIVIGTRTALPARYRMLCEALRRLQLGALIAADAATAELERTLSVSAQATAGADDDSLELSITVSLSGLEAAAHASPHARPTRQVYLEPLAGMERGELGPALVEDCEETLRDATRAPSRDSLARHLASVAAAVGPRPSRRTEAEGCAVCGAAHYAAIAELVVCRGHLYAVVQGRLLPEEVLALRQRHPEHPELDATRYDARGEIVRR